MKNIIKIIHDRLFGAKSDLPEGWKPVQVRWEWKKQYSIADLSEYGFRAYYRGMPIGDCDKVYTFQDCMDMANEHYRSMEEKKKTIRNRRGE